MSCRKNLLDIFLPSSLCYGALILALAACSPRDSNQAPQAVNDKFQINNGDSIEILASHLLANDSDPDGDRLKIIGVSSPAHGLLEPLTGREGYRYTNDGSNSTSDLFDYQIEDGKGGTATGTAIIAITPGPTANDDSQETDEDTAIIIDVLANDTSSEDSSITISATNNNISISTPPDHGITKVVSGKVEYTPNSNFYGNDSFSYIISVNGIPSNPATVTIAVRPVNDPPQANGDNGSTQEDTPVIIDLLANDTDIDDGIDRNSIQITSLPNHGSISVKEGAVTYTPLLNFSGNDSFIYQIRDLSGALSNKATVTLTVTSVNDGPPVAVNDTAVTGKNRPVTIDILANDSDPDGIQTIDFIQVTDPASGSVTINSNNSLRYTPAPNFTGSDSFTYRLRDEGGSWSSAAGVTVQVTNTPPIALGNCSTTRQENSLSGTLGASDPDLGETLTFRLGADGSGGNGPISTANGGSVRLLDPSVGTYIYTPKQSKGGRGKDSFDYQVVDSSGATASATETIIVDLKIMPLGDSITSGQTDVGNGGIPSIQYRTGYRQPLLSKLKNRGFGFDFVGSIDHGCSAGYDFDGEGWPGYTAAQIAGIDTAPPIDTCTGQASYVSIQDELDSNPADIILLHIGTNDIATTQISDIEAILNDIDAWESSPNGNPITVILARIIDQWHWKSGDGHANNVVNSAVTTLNNAIDTLVAGRSNDDIIVVDMQSALTYPDDLGDRSRTDFHYWLHPNENGYNKMADVWLYPLIGEGTNKITQGASGPLLEKCN